jgi:hypothetical protein
MISTTRIPMVSLAASSAALASAPIAASHLGADPFRVWLRLSPSLAFGLRLALLAYVVGVLARTIVGSGSSGVARQILGSVVGFALLGGLSCVLAVAWSPPASATDTQEWIVLNFCPVAGVVGVFGTTIALIGSRPERRSGRTWGFFRAAAMTGAMGVIGYLLLREGLPQVVRVGLPAIVAVLVAGTVGASAWDEAGSRYLRAGLAALAAAILTVTAGF